MHAKLRGGGMVVPVLVLLLASSLAVGANENEEEVDQDLLDEAG